MAKAKSCGTPLNRLVNMNRHTVVASVRSLENFKSTDQAGNCVYGSWKPPIYNKEEAKQYMVWYSSYTIPLLIHVDGRWYVRTDDTMAADVRKFVRTILPSGVYIRPLEIHRFMVLAREGIGALVKLRILLS